MVKSKLEGWGGEEVPSPSPTATTQSTQNLSPQARGCSQRD